MKNLGIIAGSGDFPILVAEGARKCGIEQIVVAALIGETKKEIEFVADVVVWIEIGQLNEVIHCFKTNGCESVVMAGQITPTKLFSKLKLDLRMAQVLARVKFRGAAPLFGSIAEELEKDGLKIMDSSTFVKPHMAIEGCMTKIKPTEEQMIDIKKGRMLARAIADLDIGQTIVMKEGAVVAVEAIEGTNQTIMRAGQLAGPGAIVIKVMKSGHDFRFDIPVIGKETLKVMKDAGAKILVLDKDGAIMINMEQVLKISDDYGISIVGM
ncbi:MAG: hypothetical protein ACD_79C00249G0016 [uncultured bacterium]|nr:MAG: hypothetical protein ACD_79C00249G0016 [uncultured bacterium]